MVEALSGGCVVAIIIIVAALIILSMSVRIVSEYERGVIFRFGKFVGVRGPGWVWIIPIAETMRRMDLRTITLDVPSQEVITKDNVTIRVNAVVYFRIMILTRRLYR